MTNYRTISDEQAATFQEMLSALEDAKRWIESLDKHIVDGSIMPEKLGAVIAKAKGKTA